MNISYTDISVVQDKSGSMSSLRDETIGGFNTFLADQQKAPGICKMTLMQFDTTFSLLYNGEDIKTVQPLTHETYRPGGNTALLDAIARTITTTGQRLEAMTEAERPARVIIVILTDGQENSSVEHNGPAGHKKVMELIKQQTEKFNWQFLFIGAQQDAIQSGEGLGIGSANAISSSSSAKGTGLIYAAASANVRSYRSSAPSAVEKLVFTDEQRAEQLAEGATADALNTAAASKIKGAGTSKKTV
jgi:hypothetical protein